LRNIRFPNFGGRLEILLTDFLMLLHLEDRETMWLDLLQNTSEIIAR